MRIYCSYPTPKVGELAKKLGENLSYTNNLVCVWQSINNQPNVVPTEQQIRELMKDNQKEIEASKFAVPYYEVSEESRVHLHEDGVISRIDNDGKLHIILKLFPEGTNLDEVKEGWTTIPRELLSVITTFRDLYTVELWQTKFMTTDPNFDIEDNPNAGVNALIKALKLLKELKDKEVSQQKAEPTNPQVESEVRKQGTLTLQEFQGLLLSKGTLASTHLDRKTGNITITLDKDITPELVFDYLTGKLNTATSSQKKLVLAELEKNGVTLDNIKQLIQTNEDARTFIRLHELSHANSTITQKVSDFDAYDKRDLNSPTNIGIETRATLDAYNQMLRTKSVGTSASDTAQLSSSQNTEVQQVSNPKEDLPEIGIPEVSLSSIKVDKESRRAELTKSMSPSEIFLREDMIARDFSRIVDEILEDMTEELRGRIEQEEDPLNKIRLSESLNILTDPIQGRREAISSLKLEELLDRVKELYRGWIELSDEDIRWILNKDPEYIRNAYQKVLDNFDLLFDEASSLIESRENVRITRGESKTTQNTSNQDNYDEENLGDTEGGERINGNEGYTFKIRFVDPYDTARAETRRVLGNIKQVDINGNVAEDDLGNTLYVREDYAHTALLSALNWMDSPDDFSVKNPDGSYSLPALERAVTAYPWVTQVINELESNPDLISVFYTDFRKEFISYWMSRDGLMFSMNSEAPLESTMRGIQYNYENGNPQDSDSLFDTSLKVNQENISKAEKLSEKVREKLVRAYDNDDMNSASEGIKKLLKILGFNEFNLNLESLKNIENREAALHILGNIDTVLKGSKTIKEEEHYVDKLKEPLGNISRLLGKVTELDAKVVFRQNKNAYPSYAAPNYLETIFKRLLSKDPKKREETLEKEFGQYSWFKYNGVWMNEMLRLIASDENIRDNMQLINMFNIDGKDYENWSTRTINRAALEAYFYTKENAEQVHQYGYYPFPIFSDTKMMSLLKFIKYTGDYKSQLIPLYRNLVFQELRRIRLVQDRRDNNAPEISNFDTRGSEFCFLPELNHIKFTYKGEETSLLDIIKDLRKSGNTNAIISYIDSAVTQVIDSIADDFISNNQGWLNSEEFDTFIRQRTLATSDSAIMDKVREFVWNQVFVSSQMVQIVTTDLAFYSSDVDFQKRFKEVYAAGTKLNTNSKYGRKYERTIYLRDQIVTSPTYFPLRTLLKETLDKGLISKMEYDSILYKFRTINATDGQAYRSLSSYRSIMDMLGRWTPEMEKAFERLKSRDFDISDFNIVWQTIKPFVYGQGEVPNGLGGKMKSPHQHKNSEFLLLATYQALGTVLNKSPQLRGINKFMEDHQIDVVQFESAVKVGCTGVIDVNVSPKAIKEATKGHIEINGHKYNIPSLGGNNISDDFNIIKDYYDRKLDSGTISQEEYNQIIEYFTPSETEIKEILEAHTLGSINTQDVIKDGYNTTTVHTISYDDYMIAQPTPEHIFDVKAVFGSQFRNLIYSDLPEDIEIIVGNKTIHGRQNVKNFYFSLLVENLLDSYKEVKKDFSSIENLQKRLLGIVKGNPKYGRDILDALELVEVGGRKVFNIPFNDRIVATKLEEIITSIFRNTITKQDIKGAACIAVSNIGFTDELQVVRNPDGSIKYMECYLPAYSKQFYEPFLKTIKNKAGKVIGYEIDYDKIKEEDPALLDCIGYRIPTEGKYSMFPLRIKGFLPQQNGSAIMLPAEATTLSGMDFDVDKVFLFLPAFEKVQKYNIKQAWDDFYKDPENKDIVDEIEQNILKGAEYKNMTTEEFLEALKESGYNRNQLSKEAKSRFNKWFTSRKKNYLVGEQFKAIKYDYDKTPQENSRSQRDNAVIQLAFQILTNKEVNTDSQRPGTFDTIKHQARINTIFKDYQLFQKWAQELKAGESIEDIIYETLNTPLNVLNDFIKKTKVERNPLTAETFAYFHRQNMVGKALVGIYANNTTMQAKFQGTGLSLKDGYEFQLDGRVIKSLSDIYTEYGGYPTKVSKNCAEFSAASVDNVKDPVLASLMQNTNTASITCFMLRAGFSIPEIGAFFGIPIVSDTIENTGGVKTLSTEVGRLEETIAKILGVKQFKVLPLDKLDIKDILSHTIKMRRLQYLESVNQLNTIDNKELVDTLSYEARLAKTFLRISSYADFLNETVMAYRADAPKGSIGRSVAIAKVQKLNIDRLSEKSLKPDYPIAGIQGIIRNGYITPDMSINEMREKLLKSNVPLLQTFYSLGIDFGVQKLSEYFSYAGEYIDSIINEVSLNSNMPLNATQVQIIYNAAVQFALSDVPIFKGTENMSLEEKREYYLTVFPKEFKEVVHNNPDIGALPFIQKLSSTTKGIIMRESSRNSNYLRELLMSSADSLLYLENPEAQKLAVNLFTYAYFKEGLRFGPNSFSQYFSSTFKASFTDYIDTLRNLNIGSNSKWDRFMRQLYANHPSFSTSIIIPPDYYTEDKNSLLIPVKEVLNPNVSFPVPLRFIRDIDHGTLFELDPTTADKEVVQYNIVLQGPGDLYNINEDSNTMVERYREYREAGEKLTQEERKMQEEEQIESNQPVTEGDYVTASTNPEVTSANDLDMDLGIDLSEDMFEGLGDFSFDEMNKAFEKYSSEEGLNEVGENPC